MADDPFREKQDSSQATLRPSDAPTDTQIRRLLLALLVISILYTCHLAAGLVLPVLLAMFLALCAYPFVALLRRAWLPLWLASALVVVGGMAAVTLLASFLMAPTVDWVQRAPAQLREHVPKLKAMARPIQEASKATASLAEMADDQRGTRKMEVVERSAPTLGTFLAAAPRVLLATVIVVIMSLFFLIYGESLQRGVVGLLQRRRERRITYEILLAIQHQVARYVLTITAINAGLGASTTLVFWLLGVPLRDAVLCGTLAALLNFAPYIGPLLAAAAFTLVGLVSFNTLGMAVLPALTFLLLNLIESQVVTPLTLGYRMALNPLVVLVWLFLWGWIWGMVGLLLAVPLLMSFKIVCSRIESLRGWVAVIELRPSPAGDPA